MSSSIFVLFCKIKSPSAKAKGLGNGQAPPIGFESLFYQNPY